MLKGGTVPYWVLVFNSKTNIIPRIQLTHSISHLSKKQYFNTLYTYSSHIVFRMFPQSPVGAPVIQGVCQGQKQTIKGGIQVFLNHCLDFFCIISITAFYVGLWRKNVHIVALHVPMFFLGI